MVVWLKTKVDLPSVPKGSVQQFREDRAAVLVMRGEAELLPAEEARAMEARALDAAEKAFTKPPVDKMVRDAETKGRPLVRAAR